MPWADDFLTAPSTPLAPGEEAQTTTDPTKLLRPLPLPHAYTDVERVRVLVERRAWGDVLSMTSSLLRGHSSHYAPLYTALLQSSSSSQQLSLDSHRDDLIELLMLQAHAWLKMRRYADLGTELSKWTFCYHHTDSPPAWIPWSLHILAGSALQYTPAERGGGPLAATDALWKIRSALIATDDNTAAALVNCEHALANVFVRQKHWRMALQALERILSLLPEATQQEDIAAPISQVAYQCEIWSRQGRILLQVGALEQASTLFQKATTVWRDANTTTVSSSSSDHVTCLIQYQIPAQLLTNQGLLSFAYNQYDKALEEFRRAVNVLSGSSGTTNRWGVDGSYRRQDWIGNGVLSAEHGRSIYTVCMNNLALTALYTVRFVCVFLVLWLSTAGLESRPLFLPLSVACTKPFKSWNPWSVKIPLPF